MRDLIKVKLLGTYTWKDKESFVGDCGIINNLSNTQVFKIKNKPTVSSDYLRDLVLITPVSSDIFKAIEQRKIRFTGN